MFANSMKIGKPVFRQMAAPGPDYISSDCAIAGRQIEQGMGETGAQKQRWLRLVSMVYGLD
jgi:hypothetical protein